MQLSILVCLILWSIINPSENLALVITIGLFIAIASATQDITVDALRIEQIGENEGKSMLQVQLWLLLVGGQDIN
jgi:PAT family beta-lactamase induction signal transducer AmpG